MSFEEAEFNRYLAKLFSQVDGAADVQITSDKDKTGADLTIIRKDVIRDSISSVVVQIGNLRGETGKEIEKVTSQIRGCFDVPKIITRKPEEVLFIISIGGIS